MSSIQQPILRYFLFFNLFCLGGCSQSVFIKAPVNAYHDIEGGIVSQPRLPVPGNDQKYPYVGLTPTASPPLPSQDLRNAITDSLSQDRNETQWQNVKNPIIIPDIPPLPAQQNNPPAKSSVQTKPVNNQPSQNTNMQPAENLASSANFDAAGEPPQPNQNSNIHNTINQKEKSVKPVETVESHKTEPVVMPELRAKIDEQNVVIPSIPVNPPSPSHFPDFDVPPDINLPPPSHPSGLSFKEPTGTLIRFPIDSDTPYAKQEDIINNIAWQRKGRTIFVHGYGDTISLDPDAQTAAVSLALLRAKTVAKLLIAHNVPESAIVIRAYAFGHGVRIRMDN